MVTVEKHLNYESKNSPNHVKTINVTICTLHNVFYIVLSMTQAEIHQ